MREILFRIKVEGEWIYGLPSKISDKFVAFNADNGSYYSLIPKETLGQYTGLKDKNGVRIFEGDIITMPNVYPFYSDNEPNYVGVVEWIFSQWQYVLDLHKESDASGISIGINNELNSSGVDEGGSSKFVVIGNIHDNQNLIKEREVNF